ncbi:hypothetical protein KSC_080470 [Ktedonobacter sp. SOSP1-52]|uniref:hypothetical protein n=1 Tax=Ktedonobacter sp. SOSP1-52 TaxID=2778366 RepID=UPI0019160718|nr:hypothetical protein [Ktedonobacter sp. SOSP1-52]GHO69155.1 hypothetical protein KSC_080470 [Ktedonobacter sp. SOSP1-52]
MLQKMRLNDVYIYCATLLFFLLWFFAQSRVVAPNQPMMLSSFLSYTTSSLMVNIVHLVSAIQVLLIFFGGLPILLLTCLQALRERTRSALLFCLLGIIAPIATAILAFWTLTSLELPLISGNIVIGLALLIFVLGLGVSRGLLFRASQHLKPGRLIAYYTIIIASVTTLVMFSGIVALLTWLLSSFSSARGEASYLIREGVLLLALIIALVFSGVSLRNTYVDRN